MPSPMGKLLPSRVTLPANVLHPAVETDQAISKVDLPQPDSPARP